MDSVIEVEHAFKTAGGREILNDVSLRVERGSIHGLIGKSGAGKTTTLKVILGFTSLSRGAARVLGAASFRLFERYGEVGATLDRAAIEENLTVEQNLRLHARRYGKAGRNADQWLERLDLLALKEQRAWRLSQGEQQRLGIALALFLEPRLLVMDEPLSHLDPGLARQVMEAMRNEVERRDLTVLLSSHQLFHVERYARRMTLIHKGHILLEGSMDEMLRRRGVRLWVKAEPKAQAVDLLRRHPLVQSLDTQARHPRQGKGDESQDGTWVRLELREDDPASVNEALFRQGIRVSHLEPDRPSLDDLFYEATAAFDSSAAHPGAHR